MNTVTILSFAGPILSGLAALAGCFMTSRLTSWRIEKLEEHFQTFESHIENIITLQTDIKNVKEDLNFFRSKEDIDRNELREDIEQLNKDVAEVREQVNQLNIEVKQLEGTVNTLHTVVEMHHSHD